MAENKKPKEIVAPYAGSPARPGKRLNSAPTDEEVVALMEAVVHPAVCSDGYLLRDGAARPHSDPAGDGRVRSGVAVAAVKSVREAVRVLHEEGMLWTSAIEAVSPRLSATHEHTAGGLVLPNPVGLFAAAADTRRSQAASLAPAIEWANHHFNRVGV